MSKWLYQQQRGGRVRSIRCSKTQFSFERCSFHCATQYLWIQWLITPTVSIQWLFLSRHERLSSLVRSRCHEALNKIVTYCSDCWVSALLVYVWLVCYFRCLRRSVQIPVLCPGAVWQSSLLCRLWCRAAGPPKSSRSQAWNREKGPLCDWISFWAPRCLINENDPRAESEAIVCAVTKSLPINSILNRISQSTPGVLNLLAQTATEGSWDIVFPLLCSGKISNTSGSLQDHTQALRGWQ